MRSTCFYTAFACILTAFACIFMSNYCFCVQEESLPVEAGYSSSWLVASNGFVITNPTNTCRTKNNTPHECGILTATEGLILS